MTRLVALVLAYLFLALAMIGVVLPGIPTVPFLLLSAWFAARGSERLHSWLYRHPAFGKILIDWEQHKAISRKHKILAIIMLGASWLVMYLKVGHAGLLLGVTLLFICVASYLITRPEPRKTE